MKMKIYILSHAGYESSLIFFKFQWFGDSIPNERERDLKLKKEDLKMKM